MKQSIKKLWIFMSTLCLSVYVNAYDFEVDGIRYDITSFTDLTVTASGLSEKMEGVISVPSQVEFNNKILTVTEIGENFATDNNIINHLTVDEGIVRIGASAFKGCTNLVSVSIPESMVELGTSSFQGSGIAQFDGKAIESIGENTFADCVNLEEVNLPSLLSINSGSFTNCTSLKTCTVFVTSSIGEKSFKGCNSLVSILIPETTISIGSSAFQDCASMTDFVIPNSVKEIGESVLADCNSLERLVIGSGVSRLPYIIRGCNNLKYVHLNDGEGTLEFGVSSHTRLSDYPVSSEGPSSHGTKRYYYKSPSYFSNHRIEEVYIGRNVITYPDLDYSTYQSGAYLTEEYYFLPISPFCNSTIKKVTIGNQVSEMPRIGVVSVYDYETDSSLEGAFDGCANLESCIFNCSLLKIPNRAFNGCTTLKTLDLPQTVQSLGISAFNKCSSLTEIKLGCFLSYIGKQAFENCTNLTKINLCTPTPPSYSSGFTSSQYINTTVNIPSGSLTAFQESEPWKNFWNIKEDQDLISLFEVDNIKYMVVSGDNCTVLGHTFEKDCHVVIPTQVSYSNKAFNVTSISKEAFKDCASILSLEIENGIEIVGDKAFENCSLLSDVKLPQFISIGKQCFKDCKNLAAVDGVKYLTVIPDGCFYECGSLQTIDLSNATTIGEESLAYCSSISEIVIPGTVSSIGEKAFNGCSNLKSLRLDESATPLFFPSGSYDGSTNIQKKEVNGKTIQFKVQYYKGYFDGLPIEKLYLGRNLSSQSRYTITGDGGVDYYVITSYDAPFCSLPQLKDLIIEENVSMLGPEKEYISEVDMYSTPGSFKKITTLESVKVLNSTPPSGAEFSTTVYNNVKLLVPDNTVPMFQNATGWKDFLNIVDESNTGIDNIVLDKEQTITFDTSGIYYSGDSFQLVSIYSIDGKLVKSVVLQQGENVMLFSGFYIVKVGNDSFKVKI